MEALNATIGMSYLVTGNRPGKSLAEWVVAYEADDFRNDWWFKAGALVVRAVRSAQQSLSDRLAARHISAAATLAAAHG